MLIGLKKKFIFIANTKSGSTSIEKALKPHSEIHFAGTPQRKHISLRQGLAQHHAVFKEHGLTSADFLKFGVMRDPIEWIYSWYRYRKGNEVAAPLPADISFADFWARGDWNLWRAVSLGRHVL